MRWIARLWLPAALLAVLALEAAQSWGAFMAEPAVPAAAAIGAMAALPSGQAGRAGDASANRQAKDFAASVETILARPLFDPSRRPAVVTQAPPAVAILPRLAGVIVAPGGRLALFAPPQGKLVAVAEGGQVGSYTIRSIAPDQVVLSGPEGERVLRTSFRHVTPHVIHAQQDAPAP